MPPTPAKETMTIVLRGSLNPPIFQPMWFALHDLMREDEAKNAKIQVVHAQVCSFKTELFSLQVTQDTFILSTSQPNYYEPLRDLSVGAFRILQSTPLALMGINRQAHFPTPSEESWHDVGFFLAPKKFWDDFLKRPGLRSLTVEGLRTDGHWGYIRVRIEPSTEFKQGVFVEVNDHFQVKEEVSLPDDLALAQGADELISLLQTEWQNSDNRAKDIFGRVAALIK